MWRKEEKMDGRVKGAHSVLYENRGEYFVRFEPLTLLPSQFLDSQQKIDRAECERRLMGAVLEDAIMCWKDHCLSRDPRGRRIFDEANDWIMSRDTTWLFSFEIICETLGMNSEKIRNTLQQHRQKMKTHPMPTVL